MCPLGLLKTYVNSLGEFSKLIEACGEVCIVNISAARASKDANHVGNVDVDDATNDNDNNDNVTNDDNDGRQQGRGDHCDPPGAHQNCVHCHREGRDQVPVC